MSEAVVQLPGSATDPVIAGCLTGVASTQATIGSALAEQYREPFIDAVRRGVESGAFVPRFDATAIVEVLVANIVGLLYPVVLGQLTPQDTDYRDVVLAQLAFALTTQGR